MTSRESRHRAALTLGVLLLVSCAGDGMHRGRLPFSLLEASPRAEIRSKVAVKGTPVALAEVGAHEGGRVSPEALERIEFGDIVTFYCPAL